MIHLLFCQKLKKFAQNTFTYKSWLAHFSAMKHLARIEICNYINAFYEGEFV